MSAGGVRALAEVLHPDAVLIGDSDGKAKTARQIILGAEKILRYFAGLVRRYPPGSLGTGQLVLVKR